eukprot:gene512-551_t
MENIEEKGEPQVRKRRNRWDTDNSSPNETTTQDNSGDTAAVVAEENSKKVRKSRWGAAEPNPIAPLGAPPSLSLAVPVISEETIQQTLVLKLQLQQVNQRLLTVTQDALRIEQDPNRSPSPPPRYDSSGKRTNTREMRMRESLNKDRVTLIEHLIKLNPGFQPPADFIKGKPSKKIYFPKADPNYNYIGLIIGPRGNTQKQMEQETGCKISIRGKGSAKEGSKGRGSKAADEDDDLHVYISGETEENVEKAAKMIEILLRPVDDSLNEHKQRQLRELALINGTLREDEFCPVCGEKGHRQFECPYRAKAFKAAGVKCSICGDLSHPTRDCPLKQEGPVSSSTLDSEYDSFLAELGEAPKTTTTSSTAATTPRGENNGGSSKDNSAVPVSKGTGPTILQPIVDVLARKPQTVIHVTTVMTGAVPPSFLSSSAPLAPVIDAVPTTPAVPIPPPVVAAPPSVPLPFGVDPAAASLYSGAPMCYPSAATAASGYMASYMPYYPYAAYGLPPQPPPAPTPPPPPPPPSS